jgi:poly-gamma-glutamate synthesis protein (capsule biosynthesis protein)
MPVANGKTTAAAYQKITGRYLFSGTIMLGRAVETYANGDYNQPFGGMSTLGAFDTRIGVLECPVTSNNVSYQTEVDNLIFNCKPGWLPTLKKYFPIINVSSNHLYDQGASGFAETVSRLKGAGFQVVGNYNPHAEKDDCKPVILPVRLQKPNGQEVSGSLPVAFCSYNYKELFSPAPGEIESIHKWSRLMPVIALMNGGPEYEHTAGASQVSNAHKMIDAGASFVVGNGTHWAQNTEVYKARLIVYSLGNFIFDQLDTDGRLALNLSVAMNVPYSSNVGKWLQVGDSCKSSPSSCWNAAESGHLARITPSFTFNAIASYGGYLQVTRRADAQQQAYIEQRANWAQTQRLLSAQSE